MFLLAHWLLPAANKTSMQLLSPKREWPYGRMTMGERAASLKLIHTATPDTTKLSGLVASASAHKLFPTYLKVCFKEILVAPK